MPTKPAVRPKSSRKPENTAEVRTAIEQSPSRSVRKRAPTLEILDRTIRRFSHCDLKLHSHKIMDARELSLGKSKILL